jgi:hypothetical protein
MSSMIVSFSVARGCLDMDNTRISDLLRFMTVRILTSNQEDMNWTGAGTAFFYSFRNESIFAPMLVTNKHVLDGAVVIGFTFHVTADGNETPQPGVGRLIAFRASELLIARHPDPSVDLAGIPLAGIIEHAVKHEGWQPFVKCLNKSNLPTTEMIDDFSALVDVLMVGYPTGIVDEVNNFPIVRRGITSTPYAANYQGRQEFLADIAVYGGSSGSPIFVMNEGSWSSQGGLAIGTRFALIGVLYAGHTQTINGTIVSEPIPTHLAPVAKLTHMINLGLCIKSVLIEDLATQVIG